MILITGGTGRLGTAIGKLVPDAATPGRAEVDLADAGALAGALERIRPSAIINCAAYNDVDRAEAEPGAAAAVNHHAVAAMATFARDAGIPFVTFSTDYVFDGASRSPYVESSPTNPISAYGRSKLLGERAALDHPGALVIRTSWLFSPTHHSFVWWVLSQAPTGPVEVVASQIGSPTYAPDLARAALAALHAGATGVLHLVNRGAASRLDLAHRACDLAGIGRDAIVPIEPPMAGARRPAYSVLTSERLADVGIEPLRPWGEALAEMMAGDQRPTTARNPGPAGRSS